MLQVVYLPNEILEIEQFRVVNKIEELFDIMQYNKIELLSVPLCEDSLDIIDFITSNDIKIKTVHIQQHNDLAMRLRLFFELAKKYSELGVKSDIILKHEYLDGILRKNNKKD